MTQKGPQNGGKIQTFFANHLNLVDTFEGVFNRVFGGTDVDTGVVALGEGRVEGGGFARTRWPGNQNEAKGPLDNIAEVRQGFGVGDELA